MKLLIAAFALLWIPSAAFSAQFQTGAAKIITTPMVEPFTDLNRNKQHDEGEPFQDLNGNNRWDPVWLAGYRGDRPALGVHDQLSARAIAFSKDKTTVLLIAVDAIGILFDDVAAVKREITARLGIPATNIFIAATHDHSGPDTMGLWGPGGRSGRNPEYQRWLRERMIDCAEQALKNVRPSRVYFGKIRYANPIEDSRPPKVINDLLLSMRAEDLQGNTIATVVNYAMHAEVLSERNRLLTADFPGALRATMEKHFGGTALFFPADIGGMQSPFVLFHSFWSMERVGRCVAEKAILSMRGQKPLDNPELSVIGTSLKLPIENPRFLGAIEKGLFGDAQKFTERVGEQVAIPSDLSALRIGPALFVSVPGEAFPELGNVLRQAMDADYKFVLGLCNNEIGYIVPKNEWRNNGYEESMSLGPQTSDLLMEAWTGLLARFSAAP